MKFWNDDLRICRKCKKSCEMHDEAETECPHCGAKVWFFNYRPLPKPPEIPEPPEATWWNTLTGQILLGVLGAWSLIALVAINRGLVVAAVCAITCLGFGVFAFLSHREAIKSENRLTHEQQVLEYGKLQSERVKELTRRYQYVVSTGDARVEEYFNDIHIRAEKLLAEANRQRELASSVEDRIYAISKKHIEDHRKWSTEKLRSDPESYQRRKNELTKAFNAVESVGYDLPIDIRNEAINKLKESYRQKVHEQQLRDEQQAIKRQAREEARIEKELEEARKAAEAQERELKERLEKALAEQHGAHSAEIEELQRQLAEAVANSQRAISMAQQTKKGHVYVLSNIGSFGDDIFKVGMTRRLEPELRVKELGDASVPFPFDVHAMISCDNAPDLEKKLHRVLTRYRVNRVNLRKEYFRVDLDTILNAVRTHLGTVEYVAEPEALEYRETQEISPDDLVALEVEFAEMGISYEDDDE